MFFHHFILVAQSTLILSGDEGAKRRSAAGKNQHAGEGELQKTVARARVQV